MAVADVRRRERGLARDGRRGETVHRAHPPCVTVELALGHEELEAVRDVHREGDGVDRAGVPDPVEQRAGTRPDRDHVGDVGDHAVQGAALGGGAVDARTGGERVGGVGAGHLVEPYGRVELVLVRLRGALSRGVRTTRLGTGVGRRHRCGRALGDRPRTAELVRLSQGLGLLGALRWPIRPSPGTAGWCPAAGAGGRRPRSPASTARPRTSPAGSGPQPHRSS